LELLDSNSADGHATQFSLHDFSQPLFIIWKIDGNNEKNNKTKLLLSSEYNAENNQKASLKAAQTLENTLMAFFVLCIVCVCVCVATYDDVLSPFSRMLCTFLSQIPDLVLIAKQINGRCLFGGISIWNTKLNSKRFYFFLLLLDIVSSLIISIR
jgi:hypothetical protein